MKIFVIALAIIVITGILLVVSPSKETEYKNFRVENNCEVYYESCTCNGDLVVMESYPPQYRCSGKSTCGPINETVCR